MNLLSFNAYIVVSPCLKFKFHDLKSKTSSERYNYLRVVPPDAKLRLDPLRSLCERVGVRKPLVLVLITLLPICQSSSVSRGSFEPCLRTLKFSSIQSVKAPSGGWYFISNRMIIWRQERNDRRLNLLLQYFYNFMICIQIVCDFEWSCVLENFENC